MRSLRSDIASIPNVEQINEHARTIAFPGWGKGDRLRWMRSLRRDLGLLPSEEDNYSVVFYIKLINLKP